MWSLQQVLCGRRKRRASFYRRTRTARMPFGLCGWCACGCVNDVVRAGCVSGVAASTSPPRRIDVSTHNLDWRRSGSCRRWHSSPPSLTNVRRWNCRHLPVGSDATSLQACFFVTLSPFFLFLRVPGCHLSNNAGTDCIFTILPLWGSILRRVFLWVPFVFFPLSKW